MIRSGSGRNGRCSCCSDGAGSPGDVPAFSIATQRDRLRMSLRLLDASAAGAPEAALMSISSEWRDLLAKASVVMRDGGYRQLTAWPD